MSENKLVTCKVCGKKARPGSAIVLSYGAGGRVHRTCLDPDKVYTLANGETYCVPLRKAA
jgi:hypothetical protein